MPGFTPPPAAFDGFKLPGKQPGAVAGRGLEWFRSFFWTAGVASLEGFRLMRREPRAAGVWILMWLGAFMFTAIVVATGNRVVTPNPTAYRGLSDIVDRFGPFAAVSIGLFLLVWAMTTVAVYRAVLRPAERSFFFLRLGADELRLGIMTVVSFLLVLVFGGAPAYLLLVLVSPLMQAMPMLARDIATVGALATVCVDIWLGVRLSLIAVETFAERRFHLTAYWPLARGRFWYLLTCYFACFLIVFALSLAFFMIGGVFTWLANPDLGAETLLRRTSVMGLAVTLSVLTAGFWLMSTAVFCACQAYAFGAIVAEGHSDVAIK